MGRWSRVGWVAAVLVAFGAGWLGAEVKAGVDNADKIPVAKVAATQWMSTILMLVRHTATSELIDPEKVPLIVGSALDGDSQVLALFYDRLPQSKKDQLARYIPAARSIAAAQGGEDFVRDRRHLLTLVDCMQSVQAHGGSLSECTENKRRSADAAARPVAMDDAPPALSMESDRRR